GETRQTADHRRQSRRHLIEAPAADLSDPGGRPEVERGFVGIDLSEEMGDQPRSSPHHLACREGVFRLQWMTQDLVAETGEIEESAQGEDEEQSARAFRTAHAAHPCPGASLARST